MSKFQTGQTSSTWNAVCTHLNTEDLCFNKNGRAYSYFGRFPRSLADTFKVATEKYTNWSVTHSRYDYDVTKQTLTDDAALADIHMLLLMSHAYKRNLIVWDAVHDSTRRCRLVDLCLGAHGNVRVFYLWGCNIMA